MQFTLISYVQNSNKSWRQSLHNLTKYKCIYCGKPSESLDHLHPMSKGVKVKQVIACHVVCHVMVKVRFRSPMLV